MRLVLDTNVVLSALLWGGVPSRLLRVAPSGGALLFTSTPLIEELTDVLSRPKFEKKSTHLCSQFNSSSICLPGKHSLCAQFRFLALRLTRTTMR